MKILAAIDGSRGASAALKFAARLLAADPAGVLLVVTVAPAGSTESEHAERGTVSEGSRRILAGAARQLRRKPLRVQYRSVTPRAGAPVPDTIAREADHAKADLVVVGSEGRETLREWVLGGTALRLVYVCRRPVTVVRAPRRRHPA